MPIYISDVEAGALYAGSDEIARAYFEGQRVFGDAVFPFVQATNSSIENTAVTSHTVALPSGIIAGDLLVVLFSIGGTTDPGNPGVTGWTQLLTRSNGGRTTIRYRAADGTEGASVQFGTTSARPSAHVSARIRMQRGIEGAFAGSNTENPPSLSPSWGSDPTLWMAMFGTRANGDNPEITAAPSGYSGFVSINTTGQGSDNAAAALAWRQNAASSEDPGAFTTNGLPPGGPTASLHSATVGIRAI